jgi:predicted metal-dependent hydrolase
MPSTLPVRRVAFAFPDDLDPSWNRRLPEFAAAANSVSLIMPFAEPYFVRSVRAVLPRLDAPLQVVARAYLRQELGHHVQHRRFNELVVARHPGLARVERWMGNTYGALGRNRSERFNMAFAAASETIAYSLARWTEHHLVELFDDADPVPATLFLWHLAEEVEHKSTAFDVFEAVDGSRLRYARAAVLTLGLLAWFTLAGTLVTLHDQRRLHAPLAWWRLVRWSVSFAFVVLPTMLVSALPGHHPSQLADPVYLPVWLGQYDDETGTMPLWNSGL